MPHLKACQSNFNNFTGKLQNTDKKKKYVHTTLEKGGRYGTENKEKRKKKLGLPLSNLPGGTAFGRAYTHGLVLYDIISTDNNAKGRDARRSRQTGGTV